MEELRASAGIPAIAAVRVSSSGVQALAVSGLRRVDRPDQVEVGDRFHIGSNAKAMTAVLAGLAVERGLLGWETRVDEVFDEVAGSPTLHQLLTHSAGLRGYGDDEEVAAVRLPDGALSEQRREFARLALDEEPLLEAGTAHQYSNAGYVIAAAMVETQTGETWEKALGTQIFSPLGLDGRVGWPALHRTDAPLGHRSVDGRLQPHDPAIDPYALPAWMAPAGDVCLSIGDYGSFLADQLAGLGGRGRLGAASLYRGLHAADPPDSEGDVGHARGWGVRQTTHGPMSMHTGSAETFYAVAVLAPDLDLGIALVANAYSEEIEGSVNGLLQGLVSAARG